MVPSLGESSRTDGLAGRRRGADWVVHGRLETLSEPGSRELQRRLGNGGVRRGRLLSAAPDTLVLYAERSLGPRPNSRLAEPTSSFAHTSLCDGELAHHTTTPPP